MANYNHETAYLKDAGFSRVPMRPKEYATFEKRANIRLNGSPLPLDLIIQNVSFNYAEHAKITPHFGDTYSTLFLGKAPSVVSVTALLPDYTDSSPDSDMGAGSGNGTNYGKETLLTYYKNSLRLAAVSRTRAVPVLYYKDAFISGPWVALNIVESSAREDHIVVSIQILAFQIDMGGEGSDTVDTVHIDYTSGMLHLKDSSVLSGTAKEEATKLTKPEPKQEPKAEPEVETKPESKPEPASAPETKPAPKPDVIYKKTAAPTQQQSLPPVSSDMFKPKALPTLEQTANKVLGDHKLTLQK